MAWLTDPETLAKLSTPQPVAFTGYITWKRLRLWVDERKVHDAIVGQRCPVSLGRRQDRRRAEVARGGADIASHYDYRIDIGGRYTSKPSSWTTPARSHRPCCEHP